MSKKGNKYMIGIDTIDFLGHTPDNMDHTTEELIINLKTIEILRGAALYELERLLR